MLSALLVVLLAILFPFIRISFDSSFVTAFFCWLRLLISGFCDSLLDCFCCFEELSCFLANLNELLSSFGSFLWDLGRDSQGSDRIFPDFDVKRCEKVCPESTWRMPWEFQSFANYFGIVLDCWGLVKTEG